MKKPIVICCVLFLLQGIFTRAKGQTDTLFISTQEAENIFLQHNLGLLAEKLNINLAEAALLQARAWPNPNLRIEEIQLYTNTSTDKSPPLIGNFWRNRTFSAQLEQLIFTAGKRRKNISLQVQNKTLAESTFKDVLSAIKVSFRQQVADLVFQQQVLQDFQLQLTLVARLLKARQAQWQEGNISQVEWYRIKALQLNLQTEVKQTRENINALQMNLKTLMTIDPENYMVVRSPDSLEAGFRRIESYSLKELIAAAQNTNTALRVLGDEQARNAIQLQLEKLNRVPDLTLNTNYDRNGNNQLNFVGLGVSMDLPFFNRNKGNIKAAQIEIDRTNFLKQQKEKEIANAITRYWGDLHNALALYHAADTLFIRKTDEMLAALGKNLEARNINLLEFLDYFESFRNSKNNYHENIRNILNHKEELAYLTGLEL